MHGAGRQPSVEGLNLEEGVVEHSEDGIVVNAFLQSTSNPAVGGGVATGAPA